MTEISIAVGRESVSAIVEEIATPGFRRVVFVASHGAGGNKLDRCMQATARTMVARGITVVRHNFVYSEMKSGRPDPIQKASECVAAVAEHVRGALKPDLLIIGGRSFGGRAASMLAAEGFKAEGLLLLAYPLHPAGQPAKLRDAHLPSIAMPTLCLNGTRDELCTPALMEEVLTRVGPNFRMHWVDGADHSFHVLKSSGRNDAAVMNEIGDTTLRWIDSIG